MLGAILCSQSQLAVAPAPDPAIDLTSQPDVAQDQMERRVFEVDDEESELLMMEMIQERYGGVAE